MLKQLKYILYIGGTKSVKWFSYTAKNISGNVLSPSSDRAYEFNLSTTHWEISKKMEKPTETQAEKVQSA